MHDIWNCALFSGCSTNSLMNSQSEVPPGAGRSKWAGWTLVDVNEVWATLLLWRSPCSVSSWGSWIAGWRGNHGSPELRACEWDCAVTQAAVGPSVFKSMFSSLLTAAQTHELALLACVFPPCTQCRNNYPLSAVWLFLFPLIYGGKELIWEDESEVIELQGAVFHGFSSLYFCPLLHLMVISSLAFQGTFSKA